MEHSAIASSFESACAATGQTHRYYKIGTKTICLRFAGAGLADFLTAALQHLETANDEPDSFHVALFESPMTGMDFNGILRQENAINPKWENLYFENPSIQLYFQQGSQSVYYRSRDNQPAFFWTQDARKLPHFLKSYPLIPFFHWWLVDEGFCLVHAASVGNSKGAVLLVGNNGAGKSTTALTCLGSSLQYVGDDRCLVSLEPEPYVYSLYSSVKVSAETLRRFPQLRLSQMGSDAPMNGDIRFFLSPALAHKVAKRLPLRAIVSLETTGDKNTYVQPTSRANVMLSLAPSTLLQLPGGKRNTFRFLTELVKKAPCFSMRVGTDLSQIPPMIESLLEQQNVR